LGEKEDYGAKVMEHLRGKRLRLDTKLFFIKDDNNFLTYYEVYAKSAIVSFILSLTWLDFSPC